jgi:hypothetical protein
MKHIYLIIFLLSSSFLRAQDLLNVPDYRTDKESFKKVKNKTLRKELASFTVAGGDDEKKSMDLKEIPLKTYGDNFITFNQDSLTVTILTGIFIKAEHRLLYYDQSLIKIDDKPFWGTAGDLPVASILSVRVSIGATMIELPFDAVNDLYNPDLCWTDAKNKGTNCRTGVYVSDDGKRIYITMMNGGEAGAYEITWIIEKGKYLRRVLDDEFNPEQ